MGSSEDVASVPTRGTALASDGDSCAKLEIQRCVVCTARLAHLTHALVRELSNSGYHTPFSFKKIERWSTKRF